MKIFLFGLGLLLLAGVAACALPNLPGANSQRATPDSATVIATPIVTEAITATNALTATTPLTATSDQTPTAVATIARTLVPTAVPTTTQDTPASTALTVVVPPADAASERLQVPDGFAVRIFAADVGTPRLMTVGPDGVLYVADIDGDRVIRLPEADGDGLADEVQVVAEDLAGVHNVEWFEDWLYVAEGSQIERLRDEDGDGEFETRVLVTDNIPPPVHHRTRTLHFGPDGKLYVTTGSSSNINPERDPRRAAMLRFNPDGSIPDDNPFISDLNAQRHPIWAEGLRNSVDFVFLPDGRLWANHNGSDDLGDDVPPEEIVIEVQSGKHYGWPYCYTPGLGPIAPDTVDVHDARIDFDPATLTDCSQSTPALFTDLAHQAPLGMVQYTGTAFPAAYQGNLFVAYHGSWNSTEPRDCKVQMIVVRDGQPVDSQPFLTGFRASDTEDCGRAWGRPAGVAVGAQGELFVSDDQNGNIYRIVYVGEQ